MSTLEPAGALAKYTESFHPRLRDDIVIGPPERIGTKTLYYAKDRYTKCFYQLGIREQFLISKMDGNRSIQEIGEEYASRFGRYLDNRAWESLLCLLEQRQMLTNTVSITRLADLKKAVEKKKHEENRGLLRKRFPLTNPDKFLEKLLLWMQFAFRPGFVLPALLCIVVLEVCVFLNVRTISGEMWANHQNGIVLLTFIGLTWLFVAFHEIAHGLTCKRFGGSVDEIGIIWRYFLLFPYCKVDDVMLFHNRWHRVYTAFAGTFTNFLLLLPFGILWWLAPEKTILKSICAFVLLGFNGATFLNCIPFIELDGYFMLNHVLGMINLRRESHQFLRVSLSRFFFKKKWEHVNYKQHDTYIYLIYGFFSLSFTACFFALTGFAWFTIFRHLLGDALAYCTLVVLALMLLCAKSRKILFSPKIRSIARSGV